MKSKEKIKMTYLGSMAGFKPQEETKPIYTVTSVQANSIRNTRPRCWGWLPTLNEAQDAVKANAGDMAECCYYSHVVIEEAFPGIPTMMFSNPEFQIWYKWKVDPEDKQKFRGNWVRCRRPKWSEGIVGWGI